MQRLMFAFLLCLFVAPQAFGGSQDFSKWQRIWPNTDFTKYSVYFSEIGPGGPPKDGIPSIDAPNFVPVDFANHLIDEDPVVSVIINGEARAYPLQILIWHEIVNRLPACQIGHSPGIRKPLKTSMFSRAFWWLRGQDLLKTLQ